MKVCRFPLALPPILYPTRLFEIDPALVPADVRGAIDPASADLQRVGFRPLFTFTLPSVKRDRYGAVHVLLSPDARAVATAARIAWPGG